MGPGGWTFLREETLWAYLCVAQNSMQSLTNRKGVFSELDSPTTVAYLDTSESVIFLWNIVLDLIANQIQTGIAVIVLSPRYGGFGKCSGPLIPPGLQLLSILALALIWPTLTQALGKQARACWANA